VSDLAFEQLLSSHNQAYTDAEEFGSDWMPPDTLKDDPGYIVTIMAIKKGVSTKKDQPVAWWRVTGRIEDPSNESLNGQEFPLGFFRSTTPGFLKSAARALNGGEAVKSLPEADAVLDASVGKVTRVKVKTTVKEDGRSFTNCYIQEVIAVEDVSAETPQEGGVA